jgi:hypothetical protein
MGKTSWSVSACNKITLNNIGRTFSDFTCHTIVKNDEIGGMQISFTYCRRK